MANRKRHTECQTHRNKISLAVKKFNCDRFHPIHKSRHFSKLMLLFSIISKLVQFFPNNTKLNDANIREAFVFKDELIL